MQERILKKLELENEDYIFAGDLTISGPVKITNGSLIVSGNLVIRNSDLFISGGDISCYCLECVKGYVSIEDGDIFVSSIFNVTDIVSDGDIYVGYIASARNIECMNFLLNGMGIFSSISAIQDIYICDDCNCKDLKARDILICGDLILDGNIEAKEIFCSGTAELYGESISIG